MSATQRTVRVAVDLDGTVFDYMDGLRHVARTLGYDIADDGPSHYDLVEAGWFASTDEFIRVHGWGVDRGMFEALAPFSQASRVLWDMSDSGYAISVLTTRLLRNRQHQSVVEQTVRSLERNHIPYSNLLFLDNKVLYEADAYLEDSPPNIAAMQDAGRFVIIMDAPYNRHVDGPRATCWTQTRELVRERFGR